MHYGLETDWCGNIKNRLCGWWMRSGVHVHVFVLVLSIHFVFILFYFTSLSSLNTKLASAQVKLQTVFHAQEFYRCKAPNCGKVNLFFYTCRFFFCFSCLSELCVYVCVYVCMILTL